MKKQAYNFMYKEEGQRTIYGSVIALSNKQALYFLYKAFNSYNCEYHIFAVENPSFIDKLDIGFIYYE